MGDLIGYARVSTRDQNLDGQIDQLNKIGCVRIFSDKQTGRTMERPGWNDMIKFVRPGDTIVVCELSRMSRSLRHFLNTVAELEEIGIQIRSLRENIDPSTATGRAFLSFMAVIHQLEIELKAERALAGREAAKARGKSGGRPRTDVTKLEQARVLYEHSEQTAKQVCEATGISRRTLFAYLAERKAAAPPPPA